MSKLDDFVTLAMSKVGEDGSWSWKTSGLGVGQPWCAAFIDACAKTTEISGKVIIPSTYGAGALVQKSMDKGMGTWARGPCFGSTPTPQTGDLVLFRWDGRSSSNEYDADHIAIVQSCSDGTTSTINGNYSDKVCLVNYSINANTISGYYRPDWSKVGGAGSSGFSNGGDLYDTVNGKEDAILREVGWISGNKPSLSKSSIRLSVINYTTSLGAFLKGAIGTPGGTGWGGSADASALAPKEQEAFRFLTGKGWLPSWACGLMANIYAESKYDTGAHSSDGYGSVGICQWTFNRRFAMIAFVGPDWATNYSGQLDYMWYELNSSYKYVTDKLNMPNTEQGARDAAMLFANEYEVPEIQYRAPRMDIASDYWNRLVIHQ